MNDQTILNLKRFSQKKFQKKLSWDPIVVWSFKTWREFKTLQIKVFHFSHCWVVLLNFIWT